MKYLSKVLQVPSPPKTLHYIYDWGQTVRVITTAPKEMHPGEVCSVCGMRELNGAKLYIVEFPNGESDRPQKVQRHQRRVNGVASILCTKSV
jgi:hypothetical protein